MRLAPVSGLYLRVLLEERSKRIDLPELLSIQLGWCAMRFREKCEYSELILRSDCEEED